MHSLGPRRWGAAPAALCSLFIASAVLSACAPLSTARPTTPPQAASPMPTRGSPVVTSTPLADTFPLAGTWTGNATNGNLTMQATIVIAASCTQGAKCGTFDLSLPCSGEFTLIGQGDEGYEFQAGNKTASCTGEGRDFLQLRPDGKLQYTSRGEYGETRGTLVRAGAGASTPAAVARIPLFDDDDGSPDGTTALLYLLLQPSVDLKGAGISYGEAHPAVYIQHIGRMLDSYGFANIPLGAGIDGSLSGNEGFPEWLRQSAASFWGWPIPNPNKTYPVKADADLIISVVKGSSEPVTLFFSGPLTNLALALRKAPEIRAGIAGLYFMGGAVYAPGNVHDFYPDSPNVYADWNPYSDPQATREVFESGIKIYMVPLDATNQVKISKYDTLLWRNGGKIADFVAGVYDWLMDSSGKRESYVWDLMAAEIMMQPELCAFEPVHLDVVTTPGDHFGQTAVVPGAEPNVYACLKPDVKLVKQGLVDTFSKSK